METQGMSRVLVTGATDGIGRETALALARRGAAVLIHGRNAERLAAVRVELEREAGRAMPEPVRADFSKLAEVRAMAGELSRRGEKLDVLLNNAGVFLNERKLSADGFELTMAVNHLAPFLLTHLLLAAGVGLRRIVNVSSVAHTRGKVDPDDVGGVRRKFDGYGHYAASKLANVLFTVELARRLPGISVHALHPGVVSTKLLREGFGMQGPDSLETGASTSILLALDAIGGQGSGRYFAYEKEAPMNPVARDAILARLFYENSAAAVGCASLPES